jgi:glycosyltransferase involved in cell wall biosynthesis
MTTDAVGGVWTYASDLARGLCRLGCKVTLLVIGPPPSEEQSAALCGTEGLPVAVTDLALEWMDPAGEDVMRARDNLLSVAERLEPDVIHLNGYREASLDWKTPALVVAHSCVWSWWAACRGGMPDEQRWYLYAKAVAAGLASADVWVAPTAAIRDAVEALYSAPTRGRVIPNGIDLTEPEKEKESFILAAGRLWDQAKNLAAIDAVAARLDWPVRAAGALDVPGVGAHPAFDHIECLGKLSRPQTIAWMRRAGIFVAPAVYEPFGLSILEAAACGCALVLADIPGLRELWAGAALFVDPRDQLALEHALQNVCRDGGLRTSLQQAARRRARRYPHSATVEAYRDLYASMIVRSKPQPMLSMPPLVAECQA